MAKKKIFISFDYTKDHRYKDLLLAWSSNSNFEFSFDNRTPFEIQSNDISRIKAGLTTKINEADITLVIVGEDCNKPHPDRYAIGYKNWQIFEIEKSKIAKKKLVAVKLNMYNNTPSELYGSGVSWAMSFTFDAIKKAIENV